MNNQNDELIESFSEWQQRGESPIQWHTIEISNIDTNNINNKFKSLN